MLSEFNEIDVINKCPICYNSYTNVCETECNHSFCISCLEKWLLKEKKTCPLCRSEINYITQNNERIRYLLLKPPIPNQNSTNNRHRRINSNRNTFILLNTALTISLISNLLFLGMFIDEKNLL